MLNVCPRESGISVPALGSPTRTGVVTNSATIPDRAERRGHAMVHRASIRMPPPLLFHFETMSPNRLQFNRHYNRNDPIDCSRQVTFCTEIQSRQFSNPITPAILAIDLKRFFRWQTLSTSVATRPARNRTEIRRVLLTTISSHTATVSPISSANFPRARHGSAHRLSQRCGLGRVSFTRP